MPSYVVRSVDFTNDKKYLQGYGMTYDDIVVECDEHEEVFQIDRTFTVSNLDMMTPVLRAWIREQIG